jgi:hypothetical protein
MIAAGAPPAGPGMGTSWRSEYARLTDEIRIRHYSSKTLRTYPGWVKHFQTFTSSKTPAELSPGDVKAFLPSLAVKRKVSSTTQNQAFNSLLFFYRHVLGKEFGKVDGVVRAKRRARRFPGGMVFRPLDPVEIPVFYMTPLYHPPSIRIAAPVI